MFWIVQFRSNALANLSVVDLRLNLPPMVLLLFSLVCSWYTLGNVFIWCDIKYFIGHINSACGAKQSSLGRRLQGGCGQHMGA